ncbi:unnamed protein product [Schistocephalus solidus]|uniref:Retroviral aspartyl protease n=1 Tax=Schistocephalus solidus TaxID=70667 RepID=A0A183SEL9_SCHSO|nr:unnamed protein product [Schistocephalus solidus]
MYISAEQLPSILQQQQAQFEVSHLKMRESMMQEFSLHFPDPKSSAKQSTSADTVAAYITGVTFDASTFVKNATNEVTREITARQAKPPNPEYAIGRRGVRNGLHPISVNSILVTFKTDFEARIMYLKVIINGKAVRLQLDTAPDIPHISKRTWHMIGRPSMITSNKKALNVSGGTLQLMCKLEYDVSFDGIKFKGTCYLTKRLNLNLLGGDWIEKLGLQELPINHAAPIVAVEKTTEKVRIYADISTDLNADLDTHQHPLPVPEDLFAKLNDGNCFTSSPTLPFGVKIGPVIFQQTMNTMLKGTEGAAAYSDELLQRLETVLS